VKKSQRFQTIVNLKVQQENKALKDLGQQQQKVQAAKQQLAHLQQYRQDYLDKDTGKSVKRVNAFLEFRAFIAKLDQAIGGQENSIRHLETELHRKRQHWESLHQHTKNLQKVRDGMVLAEVQAVNKREQREADDRASRMSRNNAEGTHNAPHSD
jgi:flagellar protein FliJ